MLFFFHFFMLRYNTICLCNFDANQLLSGYIRVGTRFILKKRKINFMTLVHRAIMICSKTKIDTEIEFIKNVLCDNSHSLNLVQFSIRAKIVQFNEPKLLGPINILCIYDYRRLATLVLDLLTASLLLLVIVLAVLMSILFFLSSQCCNPSIKMVYLSY